MKELNAIHEVTSVVSNRIRAGLTEILTTLEVEPIVKSRNVPTNIDDLEQLRFLQFHSPPVKAGIYRIKATQKLGGLSNPASFSAPDQYFKIDADRYSIPPQYRHFVFPPANDTGRNEAVLPHLIIKRSTLPWERTSAASPASGSKNKPAWLALLMLTEDESKQIPLVQMQPKEAGFDKPDDTKKDKDSKFNFLEINSSNVELFKSICPQPKDIEYLAHTVVTYKPKTEEQAAKKEEMATLVCPRFPTPGKKHTVHVISIEKGMNNFIQEQSWNDNALNGKDKIHIISLYNWSFYSQPLPTSNDGKAKLGFRQILEQQVNIAPLRMSNIYLVF